MLQVMLHSLLHFILLIMKDIEKDVTVNTQKTQVAENFREFTFPEENYVYHFPETGVYWKVISVSKLQIVLQNFETLKIVPKPMTNFLEAVKSGKMLPLHHQNTMVKAMRKKQS